MKRLKIYLILIFACILIGCEEGDLGQKAFDCSQSLKLTRSFSEEMNESPVLTGERILLPNESYESAKSGYVAKNINFVSEKDLYAAYVEDNDTIIVKAFQNIVKITDETGKNLRDILVTLVPNESYYRLNKSMNWEKFLFYDKTEEFSGYELFSDPGNGKVYGIWYYSKGKRQYGTILFENDRNLNMKKSFLLNLAKKITFIKKDKQKSRDSQYVEEVEIINELGMYITIVWTCVIPEKDDQQDNDDPLNDYLISIGGKGKDDVDFLQKDEIKLSGNTFFQEPIIASYLIDSSFPYGGYDSSPCFAISLALEYFGEHVTPEEIWASVDTDDTSMNYFIFNDNINSNDLASLISMYLHYIPSTPGGVHSAIKSGRCCIAVSKTGMGACVYKCMLIVGYTADGDFIYLDPITGLLKCRPNDFLQGYTFIISGCR